MSEFTTEKRSGERAMGYFRCLEAVTLARSAERFQEDLAWLRWSALVAFYPRDSYRPSGMGQG